MITLLGFTLLMLIVVGIVLQLVDHIHLDILAELSDEGFPKGVYLDCLLINVWCCSLYLIILVLLFVTFLFIDFTVGCFLALQWLLLFLINTGDDIVEGWVSVVVQGEIWICLAGFVHHGHIFSLGSLRSDFHANRQTNWVDIIDLCNSLARLEERFMRHRNHCLTRINNR